MADELRASDRTGQDLAIGDLVTLTLKVAGIHPFDAIHPVSGQMLKGYNLNLARLSPAGESHVMTANSAWFDKK